jgi:outer membrane protein assembly factor BamA
MYNDILALTDKFFEKGYLGACLDTVVVFNNVANVYVYRGEQYRWFEYGEEISGERANVRKLRIKRDSIIDWKGFDRYKTRNLEWYVNNGYPFCNVATDSVVVEDGKIKVKLSIDPGKRFVYGKTIVKGGAKISESYINKYLQIENGKLFSYKDILSVSDKIQLLRFIEKVKDPEIEFDDKEVVKYIYIKPRRTNSFSGILGVNTDKGKVDVTGELLLDLRNVFKNGEHLNLEWKRLTGSSQDLKARIDIPFVFYRVGIGAKLDFHKQDSSYVYVNPEFSLRFNLKGQDNIRLIYSYENTYPLELADASVNSNRATVTKNMYGISFTKNDLGNRIDAQKGLLLNTEILVGNRNYEKDEVSESGTFFKMSWKTRYVRPLYKNFNIQFKSVGGVMRSFGGVGKLAENELFFVGGTNTVRGFVENSFKASEFVTLTMQPEYMLGGGTAVYIFGDAAYINDDNLYSKTSAFGVGLGFRWIMNGGLLNASYALGTTKDIPLEFRTAKVHVSYTVIF